MNENLTFENGVHATPQTRTDTTGRDAKSCVSTTTTRVIAGLVAERSRSMTLNPLTSLGRFRIKCGMTAMLIVVMTLFTLTASAAPYSGNPVMNFTDL